MNRITRYCKKDNLLQEQEPTNTCKVHSIPLSLLPSLLPNLLSAPLVLSFIYFNYIPPWGTKAAYIIHHYFILTKKPVK